MDNNVGGSGKAGANKSNGDIQDQPNNSRTQPAQINANSSLAHRPLSKSTDEDEDSDEDSDDHDEDETSSSGSSSSEEGEGSEDEAPATHPPQITPLPSTLNNDLRSRLSAFLPQIARANEEQRHQPDQRIDDVADDEEHYIEMDLGLGVLSEVPAHGEIRGPVDGNGDDEVDGDGKVGEIRGLGSGEKKPRKLLIETLEDQASERDGDVGGGREHRGQ